MIFEYSAAHPCGFQTCTCDNGTSTRECIARQAARHCDYEKARWPSYMAYSSDANGPWSEPELIPAFRDSGGQGDFNVAPLIFPNGSVLFLYRWGGGSPYESHLRLGHAAHWRNVSSYLIENATDLFPDLPTGGFEDPHLYRDSRGGFHALLHSMVGEDSCHRLADPSGKGACGAHIFSENGLQWQTFNSSGAYNGSVDFAADATAAAGRAIFTRRERPHAVFAPGGCGGGSILPPCGAPLAVSTSVLFPPLDGSFTLVQPLRSSPTVAFKNNGAVSSPAGIVTPYPLASYQKESELFTLLAGGIVVPVQHYHDYHYAHLAMPRGQPLTLRVSTLRPGEAITEWSISPRSFGIVAATCAGDASLCFNVTAGNAQPNYLILQLNALEKLVIIVDEGDEVVPTHGIDVRAPPYNADPTGVVDATAALQAAIDKAASLRVPVVLQQGTYLMSTPALELRNHSDLFIANDAVLRSTTNVSKLRPPDPKSASCFVDPLIMLRDVGDVTLRGRGTIDASGLALMQAGKGCKMKDTGFMYRRRIISSIYSKVGVDDTYGGHHGGRFANVRIEGLILRDATTWTAVVEKVTNYTVSEVKVLNHHNATVYKIQNDGLDLISNANSSVDRCLVVTCDDAMCSKSSESDTGVDHVSFTNNIVFSWCAGQKAGMQAKSIHQHVVFRNNDIVQARRGLVVEVTEGKETLHAVAFRDVRVEALVRTAGKAPQAVEINAKSAAISNVSFHAVSVAGVAAAREGGDKEGCVWIHGASGAKEDVEGVHFHGLRLDGVLVLNATAANLTAENAKDITFQK